MFSNKVKGCRAASRSAPVPRPPVAPASRTRRGGRRGDVCANSVAPLEDVTTGVSRNPNLAKLGAGYLFPEIGRRRRAHQEKKPDAKIISLGIGDTTEPIPKVITDAIASAAEGMSTVEGYSGYGAEQGKGPLREQIAKRFYANLSGDGIGADEVFVSDGSKCDIARILMLFGSDVSIAVQDPAYPAYVDSSVIMGATGLLDEATSQYKNIEYMNCLKENGFFPDLSKTKKTDVIFFCNPNNPPGACATREQLTELVAFAKANGSIIIYDTAYSIYIEDGSPQSIFEIPGADECAMETCSFSKYAGFTGVRLGWTAVPNKLKFSDGTPVVKDWNRIMTTCFNGASNIVQAGGVACLTDDGFDAMMSLVSYYKENCRLIREAFVEMGFEVFGGVNAPYVWVGFEGRPSWDVFAEILDKCDLVTTPGSGFGPSGEGYVRVSAFGHREDVEEAIARLKKVYG